VQVGDFFVSIATSTAISIEITFCFTVLVLCFNNFVQIGDLFASISTSTAVSSAGAVENTFSFFF